MATTRKPAETRSVEQLLTELTEPVHYDVARGLERHRRLVAAATPLPEWARPEADPQLALSSQARRFRKRGWWVVWTLSLASTVWLAATSSSELGVVPPHASAPRSGNTTAVRGEGDTAATSRPERVEQPMRRMLAPESAEKPPVQGEPTTVQLPERGETKRVVQVEPLVTREPTPEAADTAPSTLRTHARGSASATRQAAHADSPAHASDARRSMLGRARATTRGRAVHANATSGGAAGHGKPDADSPLDAEEMRQLNQAEQLLVAAPLQTLKLVRAGEVTFRGGYFAQERRYLEVMALFALGRSDEAQSHAEWFLRDYPDGPYRHKVELALLRHATR